MHILLLCIVTNTVSSFQRFPAGEREETNYSHGIYVQNSTGVLGSAARGVDPTRGVDPIRRVSACCGTTARPALSTGPLTPLPAASTTPAPFRPTTSPTRSANYSAPISSSGRPLEVNLTIVRPAAARVPVVSVGGSPPLTSEPDADRVLPTNTSSRTSPDLVIADLPEDVHAPGGSPDTTPVADQKGEAKDYTLTLYKKCKWWAILFILLSETSGYPNRLVL